MISHGGADTFSDIYINDNVNASISRYSSHGDYPYIFDNKNLRFPKPADFCTLMWL